MSQGGYNAGGEAGTQMSLRESSHAHGTCEKMLSSGLLLSYPHLQIKSIPASLARHLMASAAW